MRMKASPKTTVKNKENSEVNISAGGRKAVQHCCVLTKCRLHISFLSRCVVSVIENQNKVTFLCRVVYCRLQQMSSWSFPLYFVYLDLLFVWMYFIFIIFMRERMLRLSMLYSLNVAKARCVCMLCACVWSSTLCCIVFYCDVFHAGCFHGFTALQVCLWCSRCCWLPCCAAREGGCHGQYTRERTSHTWHCYCRPLENPLKHSPSLTHAHSEL